ncbi:MAG TPA: MoxR family ATPase [Acidimicrobiales bacterium]|nr:MoxR family ATPase [Acidimicrobiales bacterium]
MDVTRFRKLFEQFVSNVNTVIHGKDDVVRLSLVAICAGGHILFEDVPGVGKSVLARALGSSMHAQMARVQCTPDMLPGDITGSSVIETKTMKFVFRPGPVFANIVLVDEINRATPKTQSALLEAMAERSVSVDGTTHQLPQPFLVLATQNPVELAGTFPLPEAQLDRFLFKLTMGYPDLEAERAVIRGNATHLQVEDLEPVLTPKEVLEMVSLASEVKLSTAVETYLLEITAATRQEPALLMGAGPRASIALAKASRVMAAADGRQQVYPEDIKALLTPVLGHRVMMTPDAVLRGEGVADILERVVGRIKPPMVSATSADQDGAPARPTRRRSSSSRPVAAAAR